MTLEVDDYGNVRRSVSVGYPRRAGYAAAGTGAAPLTTQAMLAYDQTRLHVRGDRAQLHQRDR